MRKSPLGAIALAAGAAASAPVLVWLVLVHRRPHLVFDRFLLEVAILAVSVMFMACWGEIVGRWSMVRLWSPRWTFGVGAAPLWILAICSFFFGRRTKELLGFTSMILTVCLGFLAGNWAEKKVYPELSDDEDPPAPTPPPTVFPN